MSRRRSTKPRIASPRPTRTRLSRRFARLAVRGGPANFAGPRGMRKDGPVHFLSTTCCYITSYKVVCAILMPYLHHGHENDNRRAMLVLCKAPMRTAGTLLAPMVLCCSWLTSNYIMHPICEPSQGDSHSSNYKVQLTCKTGGSSFYQH